MGHILYGFRRAPAGHIEHRQFDSDVLFGDAAREGWVDSPSKIAGADPPKPEYRTAPEPLPAPPRIGENTLRLKRK